MKTLKKITYTIFLILISSAATLASPTCPAHSGYNLSYQGSGACHGNNLIKLDLSALKEGLYLSSNSSWSQNYLDFGQNIAFSEMAFVNIYNNQGWMFTGDGSYTYLNYSTSSPIKGAWIPEDRNSLSDYFTNPKPELVWQYGMDGELYRYDKVAGNLYGLSSAKNRFGITQIKLGVGLPEEYINYSDGSKITLTRNEKAKTITLTKDDSTWAVLVKNHLKQLVRAKVFSDSNTLTYNLSYYPNSNLVQNYRVEFEAKDKGLVVLENNTYIYTESGALANIINKEGYGLRIIRGSKGNLIETKTINAQGLVHVERFEKSRGVLLSEEKFYLHNKDNIFDKHDYEYIIATSCITNCIRPLKQISADGSKIEYAYHPTNGLDAGYSLYQGDKLVEKVNYNRALYSNKIASYSREDGSGKLLEKWVESYPEEIPFLTKRHWDVVSGNYQDYIYAGAGTTIRYFNKDAYKYLSKVYSGSQLLSETDHTAPGSLKVTRYEYYQDNRLKSRTQGGVKEEWAYDSNQRIIYNKDKQGIATHKKYSAEGYLAEKKIVYPSGITEVHNYERTLHQDGSLARLKTSSVYPKENLEVVEEYENLEIEASLINRIVNGETVY